MADPIPIVKHASISVPAPTPPNKVGAAAADGSAMSLPAAPQGSCTVVGSSSSAAEAKTAGAGKGSLASGSVSSQTGGQIGADCVAGKGTKAPTASLPPTSQIR